MDKQIVTRFAPSPTGYLHIGGLRTALYCYLFARKNNGNIILRIEDTDRSRLVEDALDNLIKTLNWAGLEFDEGPVQGGPSAPYMQSERTEIYKKHANDLIKSGHAYKCFCTPQRLDEMRTEQQKKKVAPMYDRQCLYLDEKDIQKKLDKKIPYVVRLKIPHDQKIQYHDMIRGDMQFEGYNIDDQVLIKSDGYPTYHLANVVDDNLMNITHVIRGEEWLPSTPKHIFLYQAFGWAEPIFAHIPLLLNPDKTKLSKRHGHVSVEEYINDGYLPEALINYITFLGWNPGTEQEIFSMEELIKEFELSRVQKAGAIFTTEKLDWFNKQYMKKMEISEIAEKIKPHVLDAGLSIPIDSEGKPDEKFYHACIKSTFERAKTFKEAPDLLKPLLTTPKTYNLELFNHEKMKVDKEISLKAITSSLEALDKLPEFQDEEQVKLKLTEVIENLNLKNGQVLWPLRVALTNEEFSPGVFELLVILKKDRAMARLLSAKEQLATS